MRKRKNRQDIEVQKDIRRISKYEERNHRIATTAMNETCWLMRRVLELEKKKPGFKPKSDYMEGTDNFERIKNAVECIVGVPIYMLGHVDDTGHGCIEIRF